MPGSMIRLNTRMMPMELFINEIFTSIQGEGVHTGLATTFIRLSGCNLRCTWCDTPYAQELSSGKRTSIERILEEVRRRGIELVCITGGEPLFQNGTHELINALVDSGFVVDLETNGSMDISGIKRSEASIMISMDVKLPSSGEGESFLMENIDNLLEYDQLKFIIKDAVDMDSAFRFLEEHLPPCNVILTPVDNSGGDMLAEELIRRSRMNNPDSPLSNVLSRTRVMIQTHKVIWDPRRKGV
ncbi:MAG: 7-carboxy-7-deazaguanine synthase QueE [Thermoplasmata archaeon]|nr:MAG: 7-carboxy-7-deazaguanine synthase QueE [Thermoplasmata archaeon]